MSSIVWAMCFLASPDPMYEAFSALGEKLSKSGMMLVLFGPEGDYDAYDGFQHFSVPFSLTDHGERYKNILSHSDLPMATAGLQEFIGIEREWGNRQSGPEIELGILRCLAFWQRAFDLLQPSIILTFGTTAPLSRMFLRIAQQSQTPAFVLERGFFENTLMFNSVGQCALSNVNTRIEYFEPELKEKNLKSRWSKIESYYLNINSNHYAISNCQLSSDELARLRSASAPKVLFIGSSNSGGGIGFTQRGLGERYGTWVKTTSEAVDNLVVALEGLAPNATLIVKPHPSNPVYFKPYDSSVNVIYFENKDIKTLIEQSDICVTIGSTVQMQAFLRNKPLVLLGNSFLMGRDIAYEASSFADLPDKLAHALSGHGWSERCDRGRALIASLYETDIIGLVDDVPTRIKITDLAEFLGRFSQYVAQDAPPAGLRIAHYRQFLEQALGAETPEYIQLKDTNRFLNERISQLSAEAEQASGVREALMRELDAVRIRKDALEQHISVLQSERESLESERSRAADEIVTLHAEIGRMNESLRSVSSERDAVCDRMDELESYAADLNMANSIIESENQALRQSRTDIEDSLAKNMGCFEELQAQYVAASEYAEVLKEYVSDADEKRLIVENAYGDLNRKFEQEVELVLDLKVQRASIKDELDVALQRSVELGEALMVSEQRSSILDSENNALKEALKLKERQVSGLANQVSTLEAQHEEMLKWCVDLRDQLEIVKIKLLDVENDRMATLRDLENLAIQNEALQKDIARRTEERDLSLVKCEEISTEINTLCLRNEDLKSEMMSIKDTFTWKILNILR